MREPQSFSTPVLAFLLANSGIITNGVHLQVGNGEERLAHRIIRVACGRPEIPILEKLDKNVTFFNGILLYNIGESHIQVILFDLARIICG